MSVSVKISHCLRILELHPGATPSEIRSAFRRLARTCHPDVIGRQNSHKFEQISGAYTFLKSLTQNELLQNDTPGPFTNSKDKSMNKWINPLSWHQKRKERTEMEEQILQKAARETLRKAEQERESRIEAILSRGEQALEELLTHMGREIQNCDTQDLILRLLSDYASVRQLALSRLGALVNREEILDALGVLLKKWEVDDKTARLIILLPLKPENLQKLARGLFERAFNLPDTLLSHLLQLNNQQAPDPELLGLYLCNVKPSGLALILRHWPKGSFISAPALHHLLSNENEAVLVPLLGAMKQRSVPVPLWARELLTPHLSHSNVAVRVWAKALLSPPATNTENRVPLQVR